MCIVVKNKDDIGAFKDYVASDDKDGGATAPAKTEAAPTPTPAQAAPPKPAEAPKQTAPATPPPPAPPTPQPRVQQAAAPSQSGGRVFATPLARKLAKERNIDISLVQGTGPDGQIRANDVANFVATAPAAKQPAVQHAQDYQDLAINNFRAVTAKRLTQSKQTIPHYYLTVDIELDSALKYLICFSL